MAPLYLQGLWAPLERKSIEPLAQQVAPGKPQSLHHFLTTSPWDEDCLLEQLALKADQLVGGEDAVLVVDDTPLRKQGKASVGVARQYCGQSGKLDNCQSLVSTTLARGELPVPVGLRLYLPKAWAEDRERRERCGVPESVSFQTKGQLALAEIDRLRAAGVKFGAVSADAGYGMSGEFRDGLSQRQLLWAVGIESHVRVFPAQARIVEPKPAGPMGRPPSRPAASVPAAQARQLLEGLGQRAWRKVVWRRGTQGGLVARFAAVRVRLGDGEQGNRSRPLPGEQELWLVGEQREGGERKYYLANLAPEATLRQLARLIKGRWVCEQGHQQLKEELGLDHYEGRSWRGLHRHCLLTMMALAFLQHLRLGGVKKSPCAPARRPGPACQRCGGS